LQDVGLFAVTESQCAEDEHDDEDDSKFSEFGLKQTNSSTQEEQQPRGPHRSILEFLNS